MYRILAWFSIFFCAGVIFSHFDFGFITLWLSFFGMGFVTLAVFFKRFFSFINMRVGLYVWLKILFVLCFGLFVGTAFNEYVSEDHRASWNQLLQSSTKPMHFLPVVGYVKGSIKEMSWGKQMPFRIEYYMPTGFTQWVKASGPAIVWLTMDNSISETELNWVPGTTLKGRIRLKSPESGSWLDWLKRQGIDLEASVRSADMIALKVPLQMDLSVWQGRIENWIEKRVLQAYGAMSGGFVLAFSVGDRMKLNSLYVETFVALGIVHAVVASGATIRMSVAPVIRVLSGKVGRRWIWLATGIILTFSMVFLAGFAPPATRAALVYGYDLHARYFRRKRDFLTSNVFSLVLMAFIQPEWMFDPGVIFSYAAATAIHVLPSVFSSTWFHGIKNIKLRLFVSRALALQAGVTPFVAFEFGQFSYTSLLVNAFIYPVLEWVIPVSIIFVIIAVLSPDGVYFLKDVLDFFFTPLTVALKQVSSIPIQIKFVPPPLWIQLFYLLLLMLSIWIIRRYNFRKKRKYFNR